MMTDTQELLAKFVSNGSEPAFRELVRRYFDLVYSTAVRLVDGDTHRAEDVAQMVFCDLARMARKLSDTTMLGGWLHRHTCFVARTVMRGERRRQAREEQAAAMNALNDKADGVISQVAPILDEAINELGADDRHAIVLRFFERRNLRSVGEALGMTENAAQKRVARALEELRMLLQRHGVALSAAALASGLAVGAVTAAPTGLALSVAASVLCATGTSGGIGLTSAKLALMAKLKVGIAVAVVVAGIVTALLLQHQPRLKTGDENPPSGQQLSQQQSETSIVSDAAGGQAAATARVDRPLDLPAQNVAQPQAAIVNVTPLAGLKDPRTGLPQSIVPGGAVPSTVRFFSRPGSKLRIEGTSNIHDWQVESPIIGGFLEVGSGFPIEKRLAARPGPVWARAEAFVVVRSLKSVEQDGRPYSDKMDEVMYESLRLEQNPKIGYFLTGMSFAGTTNYNDGVQYEFESRGQLSIAGITNEITMPVFILPLGDGKLQISGRTPLKMTSFEITPPSPEIALGLIKTGDDIIVQFDWFVAVAGFSSAHRHGHVVPLILDLPTPAFKGIPASLQLGPKVERTSDTPRPPLMVPQGVKNIARGSRLTSSDKNVPGSALTKLTDGRKEASEGAIIYLRKGSQWVQMDLGRPHEIYAIVIWHSHNSAKVYHDVVVQVADDSEFSENVRTLFNNDSDNTSGLGVGSDFEYVETYEGKLIDTKGEVGRYIRFHSKGSTESGLNEYTEIEVYGIPVQ